MYTAKKITKFWARDCVRQDHNLPEVESSKKCPDKYPEEKKICNFPENPGNFKAVGLNFLDNLRVKKVLAPLKISLETAHKVICLQKKLYFTFLKSAVH
jgi:hypothetical protein